MDSIAALNPYCTPATSPSRADDSALELSAAAFDADEKTARRAFTSLLKRRGRRSDDNFRAQLKAAERLFWTLRTMALVDDLTTLYNRRGFLRAGTRLLEAAGRDRRGALLCYFDVDGLKCINDTRGHAAGDAILVQASRVLRSVFRVRDVISRLGGDEFAVLAASSDPRGLDVIKGRLHEALAASNAASSPPYLSLSMGAARFDPGNPLPIADLMQQADAAMYGSRMLRVLDFDHQFASHPLKP